MKVRDAAGRSGMRSLLGDGKRKILNGVTTLDEVSRITQVEGLVETEEEEEPETTAAAQ
jgi:hypothetical protein